MMRALTLQQEPTRKEGALRTKYLIPVVAVLACFWTAGSVAEELRFSRQLVLSAAFQQLEDDLRTKGSGSVSLSGMLEEAVFIFLSEEALVYPSQIVAVFAIKPEGRAMQNVLMVPMGHQGSGSYHFRNAIPEIFRWLAKHQKDAAAGNVVLQRFDGLYGRLAEMNYGTVSGSMELHIAGKRVNTDLRRGSGNKVKREKR